MPQYYTLEEAAQILGTTPDEVKKMAERNEVRAFRDRGSMRFRCPEVDELARRRGRGSDSELQLGEANRPKPTDSPAPRKAHPKTEQPSKDEGGGEVFDFTLSTDDSDQVEIGQELHLGGSSKSNPKSGKSKSPPPKAGSDSDVRLVPDGSDLDFQVKSDSDVAIVDPAGPKSPSPKKPKTPAPGARRDSGVHVVPLDTQSDSDVKMVSEPDSAVPLGERSDKAASDSSVRLVHAEGPPSSKIRKPKGKGPDESMLTEEIDLDAELRKAKDESKGRPTTKGKSKLSQAPPKLPTTSPFELSESDLDVPLPEAENKPPSSSDFDLTPAQPDSSPMEPSSDEMPAAPAGDSDDEVTLGELSGAAGESGISLRDPADSGISLEQSGSSEEIEFELSLDAGSTPKPRPAGAGEVDSDSEFELSLDDSSGETPAVGSAGSDSEFELSLDADSGVAPDGAADSDSEFELTLDDSGGLAPLEEEGSVEGSDADKDIFETDFEVPALDDESGSEAVALDEDSGETDSSDFDLALGDEDIAADEESGSQVVALDEDEEEEGRGRRKARRGAATLEEDSDEVDQLFDVDEDSELEEERARRGVAAAPAPANWGVLPTIVMLPCVLVMFLVTLMGFEMIRSMNGYHKPNSLTQAIVSSSPWGDDLPKNTP
jgi:excisionase family DNA binding protein